MNVYIYILIFPFLFYSEVSKPYALFYTVLLHSTIYLGDLFIQYTESLQSKKLSVRKAKSPADESSLSA